MSQRELKKIISRDLNISDFLLNKIVNELNLDFVKYRFNHNLEIFTDDICIKLVTDNNVTSNQLELKYIQNSLIFSLFTKIYLEELESVSEYSEKHFVSYSAIYKKIKYMRKFLERFEIIITKDFKLAGNEKQIRLFLLYSFTEIYGQNYNLYPEDIQEKVQRFILFLEIYRKKTIQEYVKIKLHHFLNIIFFRISREHYTENESLYVPQEYLFSNDTAIQIRNELSNIFSNVSDNRLIYECDEILGYLVAKGILEPADYIDNISNPLYKIYTYNFINEVKLKLPLLASVIEKESLKLDLMHFNGLNFVISSNEESRNINIQSFENRYMDYIDFCKSYVISQDSNSNLKQYFFYKYLLLLVNIDLIIEKQKIVYLYVEFSSGKKFTNFVIDNLQKFGNYHIIYQESIDTNTDIILSDIYFINYQDITQIIWEKSPKPSDWEILIAKIEDFGKN